MDLLKDHTGKVSQGRVGSMLCTATACAWVIGHVFWQGSAPDPQILAMLLGIPNGLTVWQKVSAPQEAKGSA